MRPSGSLSGGTISDNAAEYGAGLFLEEGTFTLTDTTITENIAEWSGGGFLVYSASAAAPATLALTSTTVTANEAEYGGGLYLYTSVLSMDSSSAVTSNEGFQGGGVVMIDGSTLSGGSVTDNAADFGAGIYAEDGDNVLSDTTLEGNIASENGGAIYLLKYTPGTDATFDLSSVSVTGNSAYNAAGVFLSAAEITLDDSSEITDNDASSLGGGVVLYDGSELTGGTISGNTAEFGGGLFIQDGDCTLSDTTVDSNDAVDSGGGFYFVSTVGGLGGATLEVTDTVLTANTAAEGAGLVVVGGGEAELDQCEVEENVASSAGGGAYVYEGSLVSSQSDWGSELGGDNSPDDVTVLRGSGFEVSYSGYDSSESFSCSTDTGSCE